MESQEDWEANVSALLDGELPPEMIKPTLDRLMTDNSLQQFYSEAGKLQALVSGFVEKQSKQALPAGLWDKIERQSTRRAPRIERWFPKPARLLVAASILLIVGVFAGHYAKRELVKTGTEAQPIMVRLGENSGQMTEDRFIELTTELLRADRRYHRKMLEVMQAVASPVPTQPEGMPQSERFEGGSGGSMMTAISRRIY
ncbi:MAG: hypothetical protein OEM52_03525 [bacterium]|nr:hypothetical protein [bacterium]